MEISNYIENIIFYAISAISALAGSSLGIGAICKWIKNKILQSVDNLTSGKSDYDKEATKLTSAATKIDATGDKLLAVGATLDCFSKELASMRTESSANIEKIDAIAQVLAIIVQQNESMVANGTARQCQELLNGIKDNVSIDKVANNE